MKERRLPIKYETCSAFLSVLSIYTASNQCGLEKKSTSLGLGATVPDQNQEATTRMHLQRLFSEDIFELCECS